MFKCEMPRMSAIQRRYMFYKVIGISDCYFAYYPGIIEGLFAHTYFSIEELSKIWQDHKLYRDIIARRFKSLLKLKLILKIFLKTSYYPSNGDYPGGFFFKCAMVRFENQSLAQRLRRLTT